MSSVVGLVLAAGGGRRYGGPRALVPHEGRPVVDHVVAALREAGCGDVVVVLGADADRVRAEAALDAVTVVDNPSWRTGSGSALRVGLAAVADTGADCALVVSVDTPFVSAEAVRRVGAKPAADALVTATYAGRRGHPVLIGRDHWAGASTLASGDVGVRAYLTAHASSLASMPCEDVADDRELPPLPDDES